MLRISRVKNGKLKIKSTLGGQEWEKL